MAAAIGRFLNLEAASGLLLMAAAALALAIANSPLAGTYDALLSTRVSLLVDGEGLDKPLLLWINDGLMAIFFLLVGLEIKREVMSGELSSWSKASLPLLAALGGMAAPAGIYLALNWQEAPRGWAIPAATDIAFALGVLSLLGQRAPVALKVFLLALAIIDDLGAIVIIAFFYSSNLSLTSLSLAAGSAVGLLLLNRFGTRNLTAYLLIALFLWICVLESGVHATLAGVVAAAFIPSDRRRGEEESPLAVLEHRLHPWVAYGIMPLFAFANAGVSLAGVNLAALFEPLPLGIALGLFLGKQLGVFLFSLAAVRLRLAQLPEGVTWSQLYGVALLTGIGFTMSLFIGTLAFDDPAAGVAVRIGTLLGSLVSALAGYLWLRLSAPRGA
ncbi:MAG TPA: Na+/H+ antiporter NhaA [Kiloniellales bacterium]|nr:Na+/H+ antiporter NhaA [Kiloniellales bacterium]